jgi:hypothetical protein
MEWARRSIIHLTPSPPLFLLTPFLTFRFSHSFFHCLWTHCHIAAPRIKKIVCSLHDTDTFGSKLWKF